MKASISEGSKLFDNRNYKCQNYFFRYVFVGKEEKATIFLNLNFNMRSAQKVRRILNLRLFFLWRHGGIH